MRHSQGTGSGPRPGQVHRSAARVTASRLVAGRPLRPGRSIGWQCEAGVADLGLVAWAEEYRDLLSQLLRAHGAVLLRGFSLDVPEDFERVIRSTSGSAPLRYEYGSTPRQRITGAVYTATEYPASQAIPMHNEMSYTTTWPMRLWFWCRKPAASGGRTPLADSRRVLARIAPDIRSQFVRHGVRYVRNYGAGLDLDWRQVFETGERERVEAYCRDAGIVFSWGAGGRLRTEQRCQAIATHPDSGESVWFNQAHLFHVSGLQPHVRSALMEAVDAESSLPRDARYGNGAAIPDAVLDAVRDAYAAERLFFEWQAGDVLVVDNMMVAHGREPYTGEREVLVGMSEPCRAAGRSAALRPGAGP